MTQDPKGAVADFSEAIKLSPKESALYLDRGIAWGFLGDNAKALADYDKAIELEPNHPLAYVNRADPLNSMGKHAEASPRSERRWNWRPASRPRSKRWTRSAMPTKRRRPSKPTCRAKTSAGTYFLCTFPVSNTNFSRAACQRRHRRLHGLDQHAGRQRRKPLAASICNAAPCTGGSASSRWPWPTYRSRSTTIRNRPMPIPGAAMHIAGCITVDEAIADHSKAIELKPDYAEA